MREGASNIDTSGLLYALVHTIVPYNTLPGNLCYEVSANLSTLRDTLACSEDSVVCLSKLALERCIGQLGLKCCTLRACLTI